jgi:hypothetical protein
VQAGGKEGTLLFFDVLARDFKIRNTRRKMITNVAVINHISFLWKRGSLLPIMIKADQ